MRRRVTRVPLGLLLSMSLVAFVGNAVLLHASLGHVAETRSEENKNEGPKENSKEEMTELVQRSKSRAAHRKVARQRLNYLILSGGASHLPGPSPLRLRPLSARTLPLIC